MRKLLFLLTLLTLPLSASSPEELASIQGDSASMIWGCVNAITGDFYLHQNDATIQGAQPISLNRFYLSRGAQQLDPTRYYRAESSRTTCLVFLITEPNGVSTFFSYKPRIEKGRLIQDLPCVLNPTPGQFEQGRVHMAKDAYGNPYDPQKTTLELHDYDRFTLHLSNGGRRLYRSRSVEDTRHSSKIFYVIEKEQLPNGNWILYEWNDHGLNCIRSTSSDEAIIFASLVFETKENQIEARGSDQTLLKYSLRQNHHIISTKHYPEELLKFDPKTKLLEKREFPDGRILRIQYDKSRRVSKLEGPEKTSCTIKYRPGLTKSVDQDGNCTLYHYNKHSLRLEKIEYFEGKNTLVKTEVYRWSLDGLLEEKSISDSYKLEYTYDQNRNLASKTEEGAIAGETIDRYTTYYTFDTLARLECEKEENGLETRYTYKEATTLPLSKTTYKNNQLLQKTLYEYDQNYLLIKETIDDGEFVYVKRITPRSSAPFFGLPESIDEYVNDSLTKSINLIYDQWGNVCKKSVYGSDGIEGYTYESRYNSKGQLVSETDPEKNTTYFAYDGNGNLTKTTSPLNLVTTFTYDRCNRLLTEADSFDDHSYTTWYYYKSASKPDTIIGPLGETTFYEYDLFENEILKKDPFGAITRTQYDLLGHPLSVENAYGYVTSYACNIHGSPLRIIHPDLSEETYAYNLDGTQKSHTDQNGTTLHYSYDPFGNISSETVYSPAGDLLKTTRCTYSASRLLEEVNEEGYSTTYTYDNKGRVATKHYEGQTIFYTYDALGRCTHEQIEDYVIERVFNSLDREIEKKEHSDNQLLTLVKTQYSPLSDPTQHTTYPNNLEAVTTITYDPLGREIQRTTPENETTRTTYTIDQNTHTLTTTTLEPGNTATVEVSNALGQLIRLEKPLQTIDYTYDLLGNCTEEACGPYAITRNYNPKGELERQTENETKTTYFTYTPTGQLATITKPDGTTLTYKYDFLGNLISDHYATYAYNKLGQLLNSSTTTRVLDPHGNILTETLGNALILRSTYDALNRRISLQLPNGHTIYYTYIGPYLHTVTVGEKTHTYAYDLAGNPLTETHLDSTKTSFTYDKNSRRTSITSPHLSQAIRYSPRGNITQIDAAVYAYDAQDQLISEPTHSYTYDILHNRTSSNDTLLDHNALNQLTTCSYDPNGNLIQCGTTHYQFDDFDRLIKVTTSKGITTYTYDTEHRRLTKNGKPFLWDGDHEIGDLEAYRVLGATPQAEIGASIALYFDGRFHVPVHDILGNIVRAGPYLQSFTAFGEGIALLPWGFSSKRHDPESSLIYFGRRYYAPHLGRFLTPDPEGHTDSLNLYAFTLNNPLKNRDPYGLITTDWNSWFKEDRRFWESADFQNDNWRQAAIATLHAPAQWAINTALGITKYAGGYHGFEDTPFGELFDTSLRTNTEWQRNSERGLQQFLGGNRDNPFYQHTFDWAYMGTDLAASYAFLPFRFVKGGATTLKTVTTGIKTASKTKADRVALKFFEPIKQKGSSSNFVKKYFLGKTHQEMEKTFMAKFGQPRPGAPGGMSFYNPQSKRTFHLHWHPEHQHGKPHVDVKRRGPYSQKKYLLREAD